MPTCCFGGGRGRRLSELYIRGAIPPPTISAAATVVGNSSE